MPTARWAVAPPWGEQRRLRPSLSVGCVRWAVARQGAVSDGFEFRHYELMDSHIHISISSRYSS